MIVVIPHLIAKSFSAVTIYPFVIVKNVGLKRDHVLINHEFIHLQQQKELLWIVFFIWYLLEFLIKLTYYRQPYSAYKNISFEREAYYYENDLDYLQKRRHFNFMKFL
jgi:hypothetical protein